MSQEDGLKFDGMFVPVQEFVLVADDSRARHQVARDGPVARHGPERRLQVLVGQDEEVLRRVVRDSEDDERLRRAPFGQLLVADVSPLQLGFQEAPYPVGAWYLWRALDEARQVTGATV